MKYTCISIFTLFASLIPVSTQARTVVNMPFAPSAGIVSAEEQPFRREVCINGLWDFQPVSLPADYVQGKGISPELPYPLHGNWSTTKIKIPSPWNVNSFAYRDLEGPDHRNYPSYPKEWDDVLMGWLKKDVTIPADWTGNDIKLYFEAVAGETVVYVNGKKVGENFDLFLPFTCDITDVVTPGSKAEILVGVRSQKLFEDNSTVGRRILPAGSMWGYHINGIWQDVFLLATPKVHVSDIYVKPMVNAGILEFDVTLANTSERDASVMLSGKIHPWINRAGTDVTTAPLPRYELGSSVMELPKEKITVPAGDTVTAMLKVAPGEKLDLWTPENPVLYGLVIDVNGKKGTLDRKYQRFGWREWTFDGSTQCLNGSPYPLRGDSWHFQGIPQMSRRYAWAWFKAVKDMNGNAVRPHAQVYPRFYLDLADEMGICVLDETANWASDGGPKLDSEKFWSHSRDHLSRFVKRDRNHPAVFGWSVSNENKPVILYVYNRPDLMPQQSKAWEEWRDLVRTLDPTRPWISSDGEDDGDGVLPATVGHYGDMNSMRHWQSIGKPWGVGEHSMAYYGTPEQVSKYNGERAYESQLGRMEGLANECYNLLADQRNMGASYSTVFNMVWYGLKPLPFGMKDTSHAPDLNEDGLFFEGYIEGVPGVQPERIGPYSSTLNPGYDPSLPLYDPWPLFDAMRAANAPDKPAWSPYAVVDKGSYEAPVAIPSPKYKEVVYIGAPKSGMKRIMDAQGVVFTCRPVSSAGLLCMVDGSEPLSAGDMKALRSHIAKGADVWIWGITPASVRSLNDILPSPVSVETLSRSSFIPEQKSWMRGLNNSDFYFCELQKSDAANYTLSGQMVEEGEILLNAAKTDWRKWNKRPEELKTAAIIRSENECTAPTAVFIRYLAGKTTFYISTITEFANTSKGYKTLSSILRNAGVACVAPEVSADEMFFLQDGRLSFPMSAKKRLQQTSDGQLVLELYVFSLRPLDDLLIEPDMPKLTLNVNANTCQLEINGKPYAAAVQNGNGSTYTGLPLLQGWNQLRMAVGTDVKDNFDGNFECENRNEFLQILKISFDDPERK